MDEDGGGVAIHGSEAPACGRSKKKRMDLKILTLQTKIQILEDLPFLSCIDVSSVINLSINAGHLTPSSKLYLLTVL